MPDQELLLFYAVSVLMSFFVGLVAMAEFERAERRFGSMLTSLLGARLVGLEAEAGSASAAASAWHDTRPALQTGRCNSVLTHDARWARSGRGGHALASHNG